MSLRLLRQVGIFFMVGKIPPFLWWGSIPFLGTPKTPLLWCRVFRGSCYVRARFNNLQQVIFSLFALCSMQDRQTNQNQSQAHLTTNQGHLSDRQSLESQSQNQYQRKIAPKKGEFLFLQYHMFRIIQRIETFNHKLNDKSDFLCYTDARNQEQLLLQKGKRS